MADHDGRMLQMAEWAVDLVGKDGPILFDSGMFAHAEGIIPDLEGDGEDDRFRIGVKGKKVKSSDVKKFLKELRAYMTQEKFTESERSYFFEGIDRTNPGKFPVCYTIMWGS